MTQRHVLVSTSIRMENGPTTVGDAESDALLMGELGATLTTKKGNDFQEFVTPWAPRKVLDVLSTHGYDVIAMTGIGQTVAWTCRRSTE